MKFRQALFWDVNPGKIEPQKNAQYVIERVLDFGNDKEVKWLWNFYGKSALEKTVRSSRILQPRTKTLWKLILKNR